MMQENTKTGLLPVHFILSRRTQGNHRWWKHGIAWDRKVQERYSPDRSSPVPDEKGEIIEVQVLEEDSAFDRNEFLQKD